ncbi:MAG: DUF4831 family protein [Bacteroidales bacterium]|jgi:hypothetical protein|nr:DUF4831 family protein [Bacteroidales bacterium]
MIKKLLFVLLSLFILQYVYSQKAVYKPPISPESAIINPTFFYTLPKTAFKVDVVITKKTQMKGLFADYAEKMLGITNYCKENSSNFTLKSFIITPFTVPDESLQFMVELSSEQVKKNFLLSLYNNSGDAGFRVFSRLEQNNVDVLPDFFKNYADVLTKQAHISYTETRIVDGEVIQVPVFQTQTTTKNIKQQAEEAIEFIEKVRKDRYSILSMEQETSLSKEAFEYLVNQFNELEKKYLELFIGIITFEDIHESLVIYPDNETLFLPVCSVTPNLGFSTSMSNTNSCDYYLKFVPQTSNSLKINYIENNKNKKSSGYRIRKSVPVLVSLVHGNKESLMGIFSIYQYGLLETLPANMDLFEIGQWGYMY